MDNRTVTVKWVDSYVTHTSWSDLPDNFKADLCTVTSWGMVVYEDDKVMALVHNCADETGSTTRQVNGLMVIPKVCIKEIISF